MKYLIKDINCALNTAIRPRESILSHSWLNTRDRQANSFKSQQIANPQILGLNQLSQICKILRFSSPQITNLQIFMINRQLANFYKILQTSVPKQS
jgi:hypothetical protein